MSETYQVFGRREQDEALTRIGAVTVDAAAGVEDAVRREHGDDWLELVAIPDRAIAWAIGKE